jgi:UDPglucose 6-dehydrogenase
VKVGIIGGGYVGTVLAAGLASFGNPVTVIENDVERLEMIKTGTPYFYEEGLSELLASVLAEGMIDFSPSISAAAACDIVFLCVGTPSGPTGRPDMRAVDTVIDELITNADGDTVLVLKSTVPIGTGDKLRAEIESRLAGVDTADLMVVSNPEFLREGNAVYDFHHPARIVLGSRNAHAIEAVEQLYRPLIDGEFETGGTNPRPVVITTDHATAEMIKYSSNAFLAGKISFINEIARVSDGVGSDVRVISEALGLDPRIGQPFLNAGIGWGGSCFGKDIDALIMTADDLNVDVPLLAAITEVNQTQRSAVVDRLRQELGYLESRRVTILGVAFKPGTDDTRDSPGLAIATELLDAGAVVVAYDPLVKHVDDPKGLHFSQDPYSASVDADAVILATDWPDFTSIDAMELAQVMAGNLVYDGRNMLDASAYASAGLNYVGIGRP